MDDCENEIFEDIEACKKEYDRMGGLVWHYRCNMKNLLDEKLHDARGRYISALENHESAVLASLKGGSPPGEFVQGLDSSANACPLWRIVRFFRVFYGFYTGNVDLTGRHEPRFLELHSRWIHFQQRLDDLEIMPWMRGPRASQIPDDLNAAWETFRLEFRIPKMLSLEYLADVITSIFTITSQSPKLQELTLLDLPNEILDDICRFASAERGQLNLDSCSLSSTCHRLLAIGRKYAFELKNLHAADSWLALPKQDHRKAIYSDRDRTLRHLHFIATRPEALQRKKWLSIRGWNLPPPLSDIYDDAVDLRFEHPFRSKLANVLGRCDNLTTLVLTSLLMCIPVMCSMSAMSCLTTLKMTHCTATFSFANALDGLRSWYWDQGTSIPLLPNLVNLILALPDPCPNADGDTFADPMWNLITLCPNIKFLEVQPSKYDGFMWGPSTPHWRPDLWTLAECLPKLKRLILTGFYTDELERVVAELETGVEHFGPLALQYLKLGTSGNGHGIRTAALNRILRLLHGAPLEILVLDGVDCGRDDHITQIASAFPNLLSLWMNLRQRGVHSAVHWPLPSYEYAKQLSSFQRLEHFGWNFRHSTLVSSPQNMRRMEGEDLYHCEPLQGTNDTFWEAFEKEKDIQVFDDLENWVRPFAAYCPTLQFMTFSDRRKLGTRFSAPLDSERTDYPYRITRPGPNDLCVSGGYEYEFHQTAIYHPTPFDHGGWNYETPGEERDIFGFRKFPPNIVE